MKTKQLILVLTVMLGSFISHAQIGIGTIEPDPSAELDVTSPNNDKGFLPPRLTTDQRGDIDNPATGLMIYNLDVPCLQVNDGTPAAPIWNCISGPAGIDPTTDTDGDGVPDITDSDPSDPCLPAQVAGYTGFDAANATWRVADCDSDGEDNGTEADCGSDPYDAGDVCPLAPGPTSACAPGFIPPYLTANQTVIVDVYNPITGDTWMDRNLGAYTADRSTPGPAGGTDCWAYGNLYQWGRNSDGHEDRTSNTTAGPVAAGTEGSDFITIGSSFPFDWLSTQDDNRWNANETAGGSVIKTANDPCPVGYRVPTAAELDAERLSWSSNDREGAITSPLKLPVAGLRLRSSGGIDYSGDVGFYWTSTALNGSYSRRIGVSNSNALMNWDSRGNGCAVRCIKD